jgi:hypothetical protein
MIVGEALRFGYLPHEVPAPMVHWQVQVHGPGGLGGRLGGMQVDV